MYAHFCSHGADAAIEFGLKLELSKGTLKSWVASWAKEQKSTKGGSANAYLAMLAHYQAIPEYLRRHPGAKLPDHLVENEAEIREVCKARGWKYPGDY